MPIIILWNQRLYSESNLLEDFALDLITNFARAEKDMLEYFEFKENYYIRLVMEKNWKIKENEDSFFLVIESGSKKDEFVIIKRGGKPIIKRKSDYTLIGAIDCTKVGFVVKNSNEIVDI